MQKIPPAVCIAGMHRSNTSVLAEMLQLCGLNLGPAEKVHFHPRDISDNPDGYFEHRDFHLMNEALLGELGCSWFNPPESVPDWTSERFRRFREVAARHVDQVAAPGLWGWKDPRNCLTIG